MSLSSGDNLSKAVVQQIPYFIPPLSMWPLLKRDGLGVQYVALTVLWNAALGYTPFKRPKTLCQFFSLVSDSAVHIVNVVQFLPSVA